MDFAQANAHVGAGDVAGSSIDTSSKRKYLGRRHNSRLRSRRRRTLYQVLVRSQQHVLCSVSFAKSTGTSLDSDGQVKMASPDPSGEDLHVV